MRQRIEDHCKSEYAEQLIGINEFWNLNKLTGLSHLDLPIDIT